LEDSPLDLSDNLSAGADRHSAAVANPFLFTARRLDQKVGFNYFRYRYQDPRSGRFVCRDPLGEVDALNLYQLGLNSPVVFIDPLGQRVTCGGVGGGFVWGIGGGFNLFYCQDECGNWAIVLILSMRAGVDVGAGGLVGSYAGGLPAFVSGSWGFDATLSVGLATAGLDADTSGLTGGHGGVAKGLRAGFSVGAGKVFMLKGDLSKGYPCPCPETTPSQSDSAGHNSDDAESRRRRAEGDIKYQALLDWAKQNRPDLLETPKPTEKERATRHADLRRSEGSHSFVD
jgi:RHS repeat-associated protein